MPSESTAAIYERRAKLASAGAHPVDLAIPRQFMLLWSGQGISIVGSQLSALTIQVIAVSTLGANAMQMGFLTASQTIPYLVLSLFVGLMIDRVSKRRLLIISDIARFCTMMLAALLLLFGNLTIVELCGVVCFISVFNLVFDAALGALIPQMFTRSQRLTINSRLNMTASGGDVVGPTLAGIALEVLRASGAMLIDAATYIISAICIWFSVPKAAPTLYEDRSATPQVPPAQAAGVFKAIQEGLVFVFKHPLLRAFAIGSAVWNFSWSAVLAVLVIQLTRNLHLGATQIGLAFAIGGLGGIVGASIGAWLGHHWQTQKVLSLAPAIGAFGGAILLIMHPIYPFAIVALALFLYGMGESCFGVNMQTCRQGVTPIHLMGRMDTTMRFCFRGMASLGAISGGFIGSRWSIHAAIAFGVTGLFLAAAGLAIFILAEKSATISP